MGLGSLGVFDVTKITDYQLIAWLEDKNNISNKILYPLAVIEAKKRGFDVSGISTFTGSTAPAAGGAPPAKKSNVGKMVAIAAAGVGGLFVLMMVLKRRKK